MEFALFLVIRRSGGGQSLGLLAFRGLSRLSITVADGLRDAVEIAIPLRSGEIRLYRTNKISVGMVLAIFVLKDIVFQVWLQDFGILDFLIKDTFPLPITDVILLIIANVIPVLKELLQALVARIGEVVQMGCVKQLTRNLCYR